MFYNKPRSTVVSRQCVACADLDCFNVGASCIVIFA